MRMIVITGIYNQPHQVLTEPWPEDTKSCLQQPVIASLVIQQTNDGRVRDSCFAFVEVH